MLSFSKLFPAFFQCKEFYPWFSFVVVVVCVNQNAMSEIYITKNLHLAAEECNTQRRGEKWVRISNDTFLRSNHFVPVRGEGHKFDIYLIRKHKHTRSKTVLIRWTSSSTVLLVKMSLRVSDHVTKRNRKGSWEEKNRRFDYH